jgi:transcriptional regulator GlxA family with amidase domain
LDSPDHRPADAAGSLGPTLAWALEHLHENITVECLAGTANMSSRTFYRHFKESTGTTPHHWLLAQRVLRSRLLLETTQLPIDEITRRSGFGDATSMRKHFTSQVGLSPSAYRRSFGKRVPAPEQPGRRQPGTDGVRRSSGAVPGQRG